MTRRGFRITNQDGIVLVHVMGLLAFASAIVFLMLRLQELSIEQTQRASDRTQAAAIARGGEASVVAAFRRDGLEEERVDHYGEAWAQADQQKLEIAGGTFSVAVEDAQAKFNINRLTRGSLSDIATFNRIGAAAGLASASMSRIPDILKTLGPLTDLRELESYGISQEECEALSAMATALPGQGVINANTANEALLLVVLNNPGTAARLMSARERYGFLSRESMAESGVLLPPDLGLSTDYLELDVRATFGEARVGLRSIIERSLTNDRPLVTVIARSEFLQPKR